MITVIAYFAIVCYTGTIASCIEFTSLPDQAACTEVLKLVQGTNRLTARLERCSPYRVLVVSQTGTLPALPAGVEYLTTGPAR